MLTTIRVYGPLAKFLRRTEFKAVASSVAEVMRFLLSNFPQLEAHMRNQNYQVLCNKVPISDEELQHPIGSCSVDIVPVVSGAGDTFSGIGKILAGVALIAAAILTGGFGVPAIASAMVGVGAAVALGGVAQLISPVPTIGSAAVTGAVGAGVSSYSAGGFRAVASSRATEMDPQSSYSFDGLQNTTRQNVPVPICYGETVIGSVVISGSLNVEEVAS